ncbi:rab GTPase-activating protein 1-like [Uloborus diversus]|uniref:rab GTPase-activating protein 1-like n=1 Tax=Uloborus diversus TaxID=327109 RepID=UPI00240A53A2|nr:rab GTPase-activating protein 1-like [Uloborus diversus]
MYTTSPSPLDEDLMSISASLADGEYTVFDRITYLGGAVISDPNSVIEIKRNMSVLNNQSSASALHISLSLPLNSEGCVILYEPSSSNEIASFPIIQIKAHIAGDVDTKEANCLTLVCSCSQGTIPDSTIFQCHVFRCEVPEAVSKIMQCFSAALKKTPKLPIPKSESFGIDKSSTDLKNNLVNYVFEGTLEFKEDDSKGGYANCPRDKDYFKLRSKLEKSVTLTVQQVSDNRELVIERCFGLLISPGRNVRNSDMQLVEMVSFVRTPGEKDVYTVTGLWDPNEEVFEVLNTETPKDTRVYMTIAADLVIAGIQEPVRFVIETKAKIFPPTERFWYFSKKTLLENFYLRVKEMELDSGDHAMQVVSVTSTTKLQNKKASLSLNITKADSKATNVPTPSSPEDVDSPSDNDEPLLSGTGEVSKDCTETELEGWSEALLKWRQNLSQRPKNLRNLVRRGIPEALRGEVWQLLAGCHDHKQIVDTYKSLSNKDSSFENIIMRDINRTFPAHELFNEKNGTGQESLLKICKAYSIYDPEVGYCQGLSFLIAALLLHMPEEQAFGVFMKIMFDYSTRDMFRNGFEQLHLKFFQLQKLMEDQLPELASHFEDLGIEVHMFASQWFLTLFTAKFPLNLVFFIIDLFLLEGIDVIFQVAVALLMLSQKELLALDFEGVLKHFRVSLPKKYRSEDFAKLLIRNALKVKVKRLKKYERDYALFLNQEKTQEDPIKVLQRENKRLLDANLHLDRENDDLAHELINIKLQLRSDLVKSEDKVETLTKELQAASITIMELEEEKKRLTLEVAQLKEMCRRELQRAETESVRNAAIISDYKQICSQLSTRLEKEQTAAKQHIEIVKDKIENCIECSKYLDLIAPTTSSKNAFKESQLNKENQTHEIENQARELELELARTKLALVEAECKNQDLTHQLNTAINELQTSKNTWLQKTFSSIRDVAKKDSIAAKEKDNS